MRFWHNVFPFHCFAVLKRSAGILTSNEEHYPPQWHPSRPLANPPCCRRTLLCPDWYHYESATLCVQETYNALAVVATILAILIASIDVTFSLITGFRTDRAPTSSMIVTSVRFHPCTPPIIWKDMLGKSKVSPGSWFRLFETTFKEPLYQPTLWKSGWEGSHCARPLCLFPKCILNVNCILNHQHALI